MIESPTFLNSPAEADTHSSRMSQAKRRLIAPSLSPTGPQVQPHPLRVLDCGELEHGRSVSRRANCGSVIYGQCKEVPFDILSSGRMVEVNLIRRQAGKPSQE
jgi:hypothetical protein